MDQGHHEQVVQELEDVDQGQCVEVVQELEDGVGQGQCVEVVQELDGEVLRTSCRHNMVYLIITNHYSHHFTFCPVRTLEAQYQLILEALHWAIRVQSQELLQMQRTFFSHDSEKTIFFIYTDNCAHNFMTMLWAMLAMGYRTWVMTWTWMMNRLPSRLDMVNLAIAGSNAYHFSFCFFWVNIH